MKKTIKDINWEGKRAVMRCDFNVPLDGDKITDDTRIQAALPSIEYLLENTNLRIYEIAGQTGYRSAQYFSQILQQKTGRKPLDFRRKKP